MNTFTLVGDALIPTTTHYGAVLFFDGTPTPPQAAVYNANGGQGHVQVQAAGNQIMSNANGGHFFEPAPGTPIYTAPDGTRVESPPSPSTPSPAPLTWYPPTTSGPTESRT